MEHDVRRRRDCQCRAGTLEDQERRDHLSRAHIVAIDRDPIFLSIMEEFLRDEGFIVTTLADGATAHAAVAELGPDLVVLDIHLDQTGLGMRVLNDLVGDPRTQAIPVVICSADGALLTRHAQHFPTRDYPVIPKPFDLDTFIALIHAQIHDGARACDG